MVGREGIEPSTNRLRGAVRRYRYIVDQVLATLADFEINLIQSQFGHSQSWLVTNCTHRRRIAAIAGPRPSIELLAGRCQAGGPALALRGQRLKNTDTISRKADRRSSEIGE